MKSFSQCLNADEAEAFRRSNSPVVLVKDCAVVGQSLSGQLIRDEKDGAVTLSCVLMNDENTTIPIDDAFTSFNDAESYIEETLSEQHAHDILVIIDAQIGFITGSLANKTAQEKIGQYPHLIRCFSKSLIVATQDTHGENYLETLEGKKLPVPHCMYKTRDWELEPGVVKALAAVGNHAWGVNKPTFGHVGWAETFNVAKSVSGCPADGDIYVAGFCTDICVISNLLILRALYPDRRIVCLGAYCAGTSKKAHDAAVFVMTSSQIEVA